MKLFRRMLGDDRQHSKSSCLGNAAVALLLAVFMVGCMFMGGQEYREGLLYGAGLMVAVAAYWVYRWYKFDDQDFNDPLHFNH